MSMGFMGKLTQVFIYFPNIQHIRMSDLRYTQVLKCIAAIVIPLIILPLLVNLGSGDVFNELLAHISAPVRVVVVLILLIVFGALQHFCSEMHSSSRSASGPLDTPITGSPNSTELTGRRPYAPFVDPQVQSMVDCYVNEKWGLPFPTYVAAKIDTDLPVPDVEAALLSTLTLSGSKILLRRFEIGPQTASPELDRISLQITETMRRAREMDDDCTLQLGSFAVMKYTDSGLQWWRLQNQWTPRITRVSRSSYHIWNLLAGRCPRWTIRGFNLQNATVKASTANESEKINVLRSYKEDEEDVLLCDESHLVWRQGPRFRRKVYLYAVNSVKVEDGVTFDIQSEPEDVSRAYWISVMQCLAPDAWTMKIVGGYCCLLFLERFFSGARERYNGSSPISALYQYVFGRHGENFMPFLLSRLCNCSLIYVFYTFTSIFASTTWRPSASHERGKSLGAMAAERKHDVKNSQQVPKEEAQSSPSNVTKTPGDKDVRDDDDETITGEATEIIGSSATMQTWSREDQSMLHPGVVQEPQIGQGEHKNKEVEEIDDHSNRESGGLTSGFKEQQDKTLQEPNQATEVIESIVNEQIKEAEVANSWESAVYAEIKWELQELLRQSASPIPVKRFLEMYYQQYSKALVYENFGVTNLTSLVKKVSDTAIILEEPETKQQFLVTLERNPSSTGGALEDTAHSTRGDVQNSENFQNQPHLRRNSQVFGDAANAMLVTAALIASVTYTGFLLPPAGNFTDYTSAEGVYKSMSFFLVLNSLSFYFSVATVIAGVLVALPSVAGYTIADEVLFVKRQLQVTAALLLLSIGCLLGAFATAAFAFLPSNFRFICFASTLGFLLVVSLKVWNLVTHESGWRWHLYLPRISRFILVVSTLGVWFISMMKSS